MLIKGSFVVGRDGYLRLKWPDLILILIRGVKRMEIQWFIHQSELRTSNNKVWGLYSVQSTRRAENSCRDAYLYLKATHLVLAMLVASLLPEP